MIDESFSPKNFFSYSTLMPLFERSSEKTLGTSVRLSQNVMEWFDKNECNPVEVQVIMNDGSKEYGLYFESNDEATLFKLVWL